MATQGPVKLLSRGSGEDLGYCCPRPKLNRKQLRILAILLRKAA